LATSAKKKTASQTPPLPLKENVLNLNLILLGIVAVFVTGVILLELKSVLLPFVIAVLLSIIFSPMVIALKRRGIPTALSLLVVLLAFALVLFLVALLIYSSTESFIHEMPQYERKLTAIGDSLVHTINKAAADLEVNLEEIQWSRAFELSSLTSALTSGVGTFVNFMTNLFLILLFMLFILAGSGDLGNKVREAFPPQEAARIGKVIENIGTRVRQYLMTKTLISAGTGVLVFFILWATGVDFPLVWAFLTFLLNFIPNIGSIFAVLFPVALAFLQFDEGGRPLLVLVLLSIVQMIMGNILEPKLMAFRLNLSPLSLFILVSLIFWGWLWGVWGMILAVPVMATVKIVFENVGPLQPIAVLMGGAIEKS
jgi:predicted PurR-regulated permease PerM